MLHYMQLIAAEGKTFSVEIKELQPDHVFYCHDDTSDIAIFDRIPLQGFLEVYKKLYKN